MARLDINLRYRQGPERGRELDRLPRLGEALVRASDGKPFEVSIVTTVEGGELHFILRSPRGERVHLGADDLFPPAGATPPFRFAA